MSPPATTEALLHGIRHAPGGLTLAELLAMHPELARRTAQQLIGEKRVVAVGYPRSMRISLASSPRQMSRFHSSRVFGRYASHIAA